MTPVAAAFAGAFQDNEPVVLANVPASAVGASGAVVGVTRAESADQEDAPIALDDRTRNLYDVPLVSPVKLNVFATLDLLAAPVTPVAVEPAASSISTS